MSSKYLECCVIHTPVSRRPGVDPGFFLACGGGGGANPEAVYNLCLILKFVL
jgi:hypothetical protein